MADDKNESYNKDCVARGLVYNVDHGVCVDVDTGLMYLLPESVEVSK